MHPLLSFGLLAGVWLVVNAARVAVFTWPATLLARRAWLRRIYHRDPSKRQVGTELAAAARVTLLDALLAAALFQLRLLDFIPASNGAGYTVRSAWTFAALFVWFEVAYFAVHRL